MAKVIDTQADDLDSMPISKDSDHKQAVLVKGDLNNLEGVDVVIGLHISSESTDFLDNLTGD